MTSEIYLIDYYSNNIDSMMHRASIIAKTIFTVLFLIIIITSQKLYQFVIYLVILSIMILIAKLPLIRLLKWSIYPLLFGLMFAISQFFYSPILALVTLIRVFLTVLLMLFYANTAGFTPSFSHTGSFS
jgi:energy-coupling factor transporter transmembrane protein EcfT